MSTFASMCHDKEHNDKIDVAYSFVTDQIRIIVWEDDDKQSTTTYLTVDESLHLISLCSEAVKRVMI